MAYNIRPVEEKDLKFLLEIRQDPEVRDNLGTFAMLTMKDQKGWYERLEEDESRRYFIFENEDEEIGYVRMMQIDYINRSVCVGGDIHDKCRGKGHSTGMYDLILDLCFNKLNMNRVWLFVLEDNLRARHIYTNKGFILEGAQRKAIYKGGKYQDYMMMSMLRGEYGKL